MIIAEYIGHYWIQQDLDNLYLVHMNFLASKGLAYVEIKEYFLKNYGIVITYYTLKSTDNGVKLLLVLKDKEIEAKTLYAISENAIFGCETTYGDKGEEYSSSYILLDINQTIEQL